MKFIVKNFEIVNYSSSLRTKEENFDNVCFESSKPAVVNRVQGSQGSNNVETKIECIGKPLPPQYG